ncbi:MAG: dephospho-CoA kinase [Gammaproteobacteria bacterium]|nr:dephospho-CoA kinase [Gammaproteobacteria bacterium]NNF66264.1 dephospho-CoA kinase [Gammaproteobacteria bacterium]
MKIGLTGGIASGKTTVANLFAELGVPVIDTDVIAREIVEPGQPALSALVQAFGKDILDDDGRLNRRRMRDRIFSNDDERRRLESILHPIIGEQLLRQSEAAGGAYQILVVPLLMETGMACRVDRVLVVDCSPQTQIERLTQRDGETKASARRILDAQIDRARRLAIADDVVVNDGDPEQVRAQVQELHRRYLLQPA